MVSLLRVIIISGAIHLGPDKQVLLGFLGFVFDSLQC